MVAIQDKPLAVRIFRHGILVNKIKEKNPIEFELQVKGQDHKVTINVKLNGAIEDRLLQLHVCNRHQTWHIYE